MKPESLHGRSWVEQVPPWNLFCICFKTSNIWLLWKWCQGKSGRTGNRNLHRRLYFSGHFRCLSFSLHTIEIRIIFVRTKQIVHAGRYSCLVYDSLPVQNTLWHDLDLAFWLWGRIKPYWPCPTQNSILLGFQNRIFAYIPLQLWSLSLKSGNFLFLNSIKSKFLCLIFKGLYNLTSSNCPNLSPTTL